MQNVNWCRMHSIEGSFLVQKLSTLSTAEYLEERLKEGVEQSACSNSGGGLEGWVAGPSEHMELFLLVKGYYLFTISQSVSQSAVGPLFLCMERDLCQLSRPTKVDV